MPAIECCIETRPYGRVYEGLKYGTSLRCCVCEESSLRIGRVDKQLRKTTNGSIVIDVFPKLTEKRHSATFNITTHNFVVNWLKEICSLGSLPTFLFYKTSKISFYYGTELRPQAGYASEQHASVAIIQLLNFCLNSRTYDVSCMEEKIEIFLHVSLLGRVDRKTPF